MSDTHNTRNYFAHGGGEWVIGGKLTVLEGATVEGLTATAAPASADALGGIKAAAKALGGGGGGRSELAQGGGPDVAKLEEALAAGREAMKA